MNAMISRTWIILPAICLSLALFFQPVASGQPAQPELQEQMKKKLDNMGELLTGLALDDWAKIEKAAEGLVSTCEALGWTGPGQEAFKMKDAGFHESTQKLLKAAKKRNLADTQREFINATIMCWGCHDLGSQQPVTK